MRGVAAVDGVGDNGEAMASNSLGVGATGESLILMFLGKKPRVCRVGALTTPPLLLSLRIFVVAVAVGATPVDISVFPFSCFLSFVCTLSSLPKRLCQPKKPSVSVYLARSLRPSP